MTEVSDPLTLRYEQVVDPIRQSVQGAPDLGGLLGPAGPRPGREVALVQPVRDRAELSNRGAHTPTEFAGHEDCRPHQHRAQGPERQPPRHDTSSNLILRHGGQHHVDPTRASDRDDGVNAMVLVHGHGLQARASAVDGRLGIGRQRLGAAQVLAGGGHDDDCGAGGANGGHRLGQGPLIGDRADQRGHVLCLVAGSGGGAVLGNHDQEQTQGDDKSHHQSRARRGDQPGDAAAHQRSAGVISGAARRTPT